MARLSRPFFVALLAQVTVWEAAPAKAQGNCTTIDVDMLPAKQDGNPFDPQIVGWIATRAGDPTFGTFVDTAFITEQTGTFGIGNRPGRFDFNSGPAWPYGRRTTVFPLWSHRHGLVWDQLDFQDGDDNNLSHPFDDSSREIHFCRPLQPTEPAFDAMTCASQVFTDKGVFDTTGKKSNYPPRNDVTRAVTDNPIVDTFDSLNPFDAVSTATPPSGTLATLTYQVPENLPPGDYYMFVEVAREFDMNATYNPTVFPAPTGIPFADYGEPYRGQPSVLYRVSFTLDANNETTATTTDVIGYGDPTGEDDILRDASDGTITTNVPGSGTSRLQLVSVDGNTFRIRLTARPQFDITPPALPDALQIVDVTQTTATVGFLAPGDDGATGKVKKYEARYRVGDTITADNFADSIEVTTSIKPVAAGGTQQVSIMGLLPATTYSIGIRAVDDCHNNSDIAVIDVTTPARGVGEVDACFVATAAYGSLLAGEVDMLRRFRDAALRHSALGELAVETYYTFGPALSGLVGESELLRATSREALAPVVDRVKVLRVRE